MPESQIDYFDVETGKALALLPDPFVTLSSASVAWQGIIVEQMRLPPLEMPDSRAVNHLLTLKLSAPSRLEWKDGARSRSRVFAPGDVCVTPAHSPRQLRWGEEVELLVLALDPLLLFQAAKELPHPRIELLQTHGEPDPQIQFIALALRAELESGGAGGRLFADSLANALALRLLSRYNGFPLPLSHSSGGLSASALRCALEFMQDNLANDLSLAGLAEALHMSTTRFKTAFKRSTGLAPHQYLIAQRVERAKQLLLRGDLTPGQVAVLAGFYDQSHLIRHFKRIVGVTPGVYVQSV